MVCLNDLPRRSRPNKSGDLNRLVYKQRGTPTYYFPECTWKEMELLKKRFVVEFHKITLGYAKFP